MGKIILYGTILSPPVRAVLMTAEQIGIELEFKFVDLLNKEHLSEEYLNKNPQHTVPTLDDNGKIIWDSHAISTYLIGMYAKNDSLYPKDLYKRALVDQRLHFDTGILFVRLRAIVEGIVFKNNPTIDKDKVDAIYNAYDFMEQFFAKDDYLVGNTLTVADLCCFASVSTLHATFAPVSSEKYPKLTAWMNCLTELPCSMEKNAEGVKAIAKFVNEKIQELLNKN